MAFIVNKIILSALLDAGILIICVPFSLHSTMRYFTTKWNIATLERSVRRIFFNRPDRLFVDISALALSA